jgi:hypothetical protein
MSPEQLLDEIREANIPHDRIAEAMGRSRTAATKLLAGDRALKVQEIVPLTRLLLDWRKERRGVAATRHQPATEEESGRYARVPVLPFFAGMGGGGMGEVLASESLDRALVPRVLIEDYFRGRPEDFVLLRVRGDSMEPDFQHDDELLCDLRDRNPTQPGPFALFHEEGYFVKNVERLPDGQVRIFSSNPKYTSVSLATEQTQIIGRPVWFGRRL